MRCRVSVDTNASGLLVDLRLNVKIPESSIVCVSQGIRDDGEVSLAVSDDKHEGAAATVVLLDAAGQVLDYRADNRRRRRMSMELDHLDKAGGVGLRRIPGAQGPRPEVLTPIPRANVRGRVPAWPLLRERRRQGDRRGLEIVEKQLKDRTVRTGEEELFKARAQGNRVGQAHRHFPRPARRKERLLCRGTAEPCSARRAHRRRARARERAMLTDGFYAEVTFTYDGIIAQEKGGRPFEIETLRPIQMSKSDVLEHLR